MAQAVVVGGDPDDFVVPTGSGLDGVVRYHTYLGGRAQTKCNGALLKGGRRILTAAHCLTDSKGKVDRDQVSVFFDLPGNTVQTPRIGKFKVHPNWNGDLQHGYDVAIIQLEEEAPEAADRYEIYRGNDEIGRTGQVVGYGRSGNGNDGAQRSPRIRKLSARNKIDALPEDFLGVFSNFDDTTPGTQLGFDFDNGEEENDAFGRYIDEPDLGLGEEEGIFAVGDSGGPTFIDGQVAGIHSYLITNPQRPGRETSDIDEFHNASFGEIAFDTRVSVLADWIDSFEDDHPVQVADVPAPGMLVLLGFCLSILAGVRSERT
ncbi:MAG: trypsin-like serine protease [Minwuiales bacterium]|nr:trypsin-like serine protease [Minwuiales bacterium]